MRVWEAVLGVPLFEAWAWLGSTNDRVTALARDGARPWTTVVADEQRRGRGRGGRTWVSPPGKGLWMSVLLRPLGGEARLLTPLVVGVAVARAVEAVTEGVRAGVKWPNDVLLMPRGADAARGGPRKVCGILCEGVGDDVVAGIGVNVAQDAADFPAGLRAGATSLRLASGRPPARGELARALVGALREAFARPVTRLEGEVAEELAERDVLRGRRVRVEGGPEGTARGIDPGGRLRVEVAPGDVRRVVAGTVRVVPAGGDGVPEGTRARDGGGQGS